MSSLLDLVRREFDGDGPARGAVTGKLTDLLLGEVIRQGLREGDGLDEAMTDPQVAAALRLIRDRPEDPWTVERLAADVALARSTFASRFRAVTGESPMRYLRRYRLAEAARLLRETTPA